ncbi:MAG: hypothetical protein ACRDMV_09420 [Streptosporangiales bacterium]
MNLSAAAGERPLGSALLDQRIVAGVGTIYLSEICFLTGLSPLTPVDTADRPVRNEVVATARRLLWTNRMRPDRTTTGDHRSGRRYWATGRGAHPCRHCGAAVHRL